MQLSALQYRKLDFEEFAAATLSVHQLEALDTWEQQALRGFELFEKDGNKPIMIEELASVFFLTIIFLLSSFSSNRVFFILSVAIRTRKMLITFSDFLHSCYQELGLAPSVPVHVVLQDWIRHSDGKLSFLGFVKLLHGASTRSIAKISD